MWLYSLGVSVWALLLGWLLAIENVPTPKNVMELKSYLGLLSYYGKFLPNLATRLATCWARRLLGAGRQPGRQRSVSQEATHFISVVGSL